MLSSTILQFISFAFHGTLSVLLWKRYLAKTRFNDLVIFALPIFHGLMAPILVNAYRYNNVLPYMAITVLVLIEVFLLFKDKALGTLGVGLGLALHYFTCRSITLAIHSLIIDMPMYEILRTPNLVKANTTVVMLVHCVVLILFMCFIKPQAVSEIIDNKILAVFINVQMGLLVIFFIYASSLFTVIYQFEELPILQITLPIMLLITFYIMLIFMVRLVSNDEYRKIISDLEHKLDANQIVTDALFDRANMIMDFNVSRDTISKVIFNSVDVPYLKQSSYTSFAHRVSATFHSDDQYLLNKLSSENLLNEFNVGRKEISYEYRCIKNTFDKENNIFVPISGDFFWFKITLKLKKDSDSGDIIGLYVIEDIHQEKEAELSLIRKSRIDPLTGAFNKEAIKDIVTDHLSRKLKGILFVFDIDNFKSVNDNMGHAFGDDLLLEVHQKIFSVFREEDYIGRFGGDEFVAFIPDIDDVEEATGIANRICNNVKAMYVSDDGLEIVISASIGIAVCPIHGSDYDSLFMAADKALYRSKSKGKNTYTVYSN